MGIKDLWSVLSPYAERKPINELRGKKVAIDLAGWVCESLNVVDYFVHPRQHLKNLFFRTCYLIWEEVTPVFVLEGEAPKLKSQVIAKRNELQFRGVKPKDKPSPPTQSQSQPKKDKGRTRFNHVLKQCENLLRSMGIQCVQGPGEAEAYCAFLNKKGLVDGVISQDSDCFGYGAIRVYRNFSVSTQGAQAAAGGAVDIYDMRQICKHIDFGQNKIIVMALLCGCDYCPDGIGGIGKDGVLKLFNKYKDEEILTRLRDWRSECHKYNSLEMRVDDKTICSNCGHIGRTQSHTKSGCAVCRTSRGCDESLWKEQRLSLKAELTLRKKALTNPTFPSEEIIAEFQAMPLTVPDLNLNWRQPNIIKFIKQVGNLLQWSEIYCFQKFFPILTRWQVQNAHRLSQLSKDVTYVEPKEIVKKRTVKGVPSFEIVWLDARGCFKGLIPDVQIKDYEIEHPKGIEELYYTVEPQSMVEAAYPEMVAAYLKSKEKPKKVAKKTKTKDKAPLNALENIQDLIAATDEIAKTVKKPKRAKKTNAPQKGLQLIDKFMKYKENTPVKVQKRQQCSTPKIECPSDLDSDCDAEFNMSDVISGIINNPQATPAVTEIAGYRLYYEPITHDLSLRLEDPNSDGNEEINTEERNTLRTQCQLDDADLMSQKRNISICAETHQNAKRYSLDDSFDMLVKGAKAGVSNVKHLMEKSMHLMTSSSPIQTHVERFKHVQRLSISSATAKQQQEDDHDVSYFFHQSGADDDGDAFERLMDMSIGRRQANELVVISDSE